MTAHAQLLAIAAETSTPQQFRIELLRWTRQLLDADVALLATLRPEQHTALGFTPEAEQALRSNWDHYGEELEPVRQQALQQHVACDREVLGAHLTRTHVYRDVMAPSRGRESLFLMPSFRGRPLGLLMVGRHQKGFSKAARQRLVSLSPGLGVVLDAGLTEADGASPAGTLRLTSAELDLLDYLALGYSTRDMALARGTSPYTVRNQLSRLYRKLGVSNRTEAVGLHSAMGRSTHR